MIYNDSEARKIRGKGSLTFTPVFTVLFIRYKRQRSTTLNKKYTPYLIGLGIFTLLFGIFVELAVHEINPEDFSVPYYASIETTEITTVKPTETTTVTVPETTAEITTERITEKPKTEKPSSRSVSKKSNGKNFRITVYTPSSDGGK